MAILVQYTDKTFGAVSNNDLDTLIASKKIIGFRRSGGWVDVSTGPLRRQDSPQQYLGQERRTGQVSSFS
jgi:hypothetical protein